MQVFNKFFLASLGLGLCISQAAHAQLGVGTGATAPRAALDVNGAIATYETTATLTGANPTYSIAAGVGQLLLSPAASAPTGAVALTCATTPVAGQRLVVVNSTAIPAALSSLTIPAGQAVEFVYSASAWRASSDGGNATALANGLTKGTTANSMKLGGALTEATDIALASNNLTFSGTGSVGIGVAAPSQTLDVSGTARLRSIPSGSGTVMLTADNTGVIRQQALPTASAPAIIGTLGAGANLTSANWANFNYTGGSITIPANSKYIIQGYILLTSTTIPTSAQSMWVRSSFSESASAYTQTADLQGPPYISGLLASNAPYSMMVGAVVLKNSSGSPKTYYYWAGSVNNVGTYAGTISTVGGSTWLENQLFALPIN